MNREATKMLALSTGKIYKYENLIGKEILPSDQRRAIAQAKFTYSALGKALEKQTKTIEDQEKNKLKHWKSREIALVNKIIMIVKRLW